MPRLPMPTPHLNPEPGQRLAKVTWQTFANGRNLSAIRVRLERALPFQAVQFLGPFPWAPLPTPGAGLSHLDVSSLVSTATDPSAWLSLLFLTPSS